MSDEHSSQRYGCKPAVWHSSGDRTFSEGSWSRLDWSGCESASLSETATGGDVREPTTFKACWSPEYVYIEFRCVDHHIVSRFTERDEPLYEQDVVEVFMDGGGTDGASYVELEVSPRGVVFDAKVWNDGNRVIELDLAWNMEGLMTEVEVHEDLLLYRLAVPTSHFAAKPAPGVSWRVNFYRIDEDADGKREYQAWSPTGAINFHLPARFGELMFEDHEIINDI